MRARLALFALLAVALIATLLSASGGGGWEHPKRHRPAQPPTVVGATAPPARPKPQPQAKRTPARPPSNETDPQDHDPRLRARLRRAQVTGAAFQQLPWAGDGIAIDFGEAGGDGRVQLDVTYLATRADARRAYRRFLARFGDDGSGYSVTFRRSAGG